MTPLGKGQRSNLPALSGLTHSRSIPQRIADRHRQSLRPVGAFPAAVADGAPRQLFLSAFSVMRRFFGPRLITTDKTSYQVFSWAS